jgi:hypothetical protein
MVSKLFCKKKIMKLILSLFITFCIFHYYGQTSCFSSKDDVMTYVIGKSFESSDGKIKLSFNTSQATLKAGSSTFNYMYDKFSYLGSGHKGVIEMMELSGELGGLKMSVSCKEQMMTDNKGMLLYEGSSGNNTATIDAPKFNAIDTKNEIIINGIYLSKIVLYSNISWNDAKAYVSKLGDGWRLPTSKELIEINGKGIFKELFSNSSQANDMQDYHTDEKYCPVWANNEEDSMANYICFCNSRSGQEGYSETNNKFYFIAVQEKKLNNIIGKYPSKYPCAKIGQLEIMRSDLSQMKKNILEGYPDNESFNFTIAEAISSCSKLGDGWRLPTKEELEIISKNSDSIGNFKNNGTYWSSTEDNSKMAAWVHNVKKNEGFMYGKHMSNNYNVRAVRNFLTDKELQEISATEKQKRDTEEAEKRAKNKLENKIQEDSKEAKDAQEIARLQEIRNKGINDSKINYKGKKSGAGWTVATTLLFSPIVGVIPAAVCASKAPSDKNLNYPNDELMKNKDYKEEYIKKAHKTKKKKVWISYATSSAAWIIIILLL